MPCPYFYPVEQLAWPNAPRLPLGDAYAGLCHSDPACAAEPDARAVRELCNLGYARGRCHRFPPADGPDAVRFAVARDAGDVIRICWVREHDHHPLDHGVLEYSRQREAFAGAIPEAVVQQQAQAYLASYLRRLARRRREA